MTIAAAVGLGVALGAAAATPAEPRAAGPREPIDWIAWSPGPKIVFDAFVGTYALGTSGPPRRLRTFRGFGNPVWSPSGRLLALSSDEGGIVLAFPNGKLLRRISRDGVLPSWSPTAHALAFQTIGLERPAAIWTVQADGRRERRLASLRRGSDFSRGPAWSPDGGSLVFAACLRVVREGEDCGGLRRGIGIFTIRADGKGLRRLAFGRCPVWSPAREIAFSAHGRVPGLAIAKSDGSGRRTVARAATSCPAWSPDGRSVAAEGARSLLVAVRGSWTVRRVGRLPPFPTCCAYPAPPAPAWSPDGTSLAVVRPVEGRNATLSYRLYVVRVRDGRTRLLLRTPYS
jgi:Tol biopolymer transport system component